MPWHLSKSDLCKVYDSRHETVCICQNAEQAALIVQAVNALPRADQDSFIRLREPVNTANTANAVSAVSLTHTHAAEGCCARAIAKAIGSGVMNSLTVWECPKCGTEYHARREGPVVHWEARAAVQVFRL